MRHNYGEGLGRRVGALVLGAALLSLLPALPESTAEAGFLKDGVRPGAGDRLRTLVPPRAGSRDRIKPPGTPQATAPSSAPRKESHGWFWQVHAAKGAADAARWAPALDSLRQRRAGGKALVDADSLLAIRHAFGKDLAAAAARHNLSEALLIAVISVESRGTPQAVSPKGAQGLMQLIPSTAKRFGVSDPFDAAQNIGGGAAYLDWLLTEFRGDALLALAGYNAGEGAVRKHKGVPPYAETRDYIVKVLDAVAALEAACATPPISPRAICQWRAEG